MSHANALLTPRTRERLARLVVNDGWTASMAAKMFMVSPVTAHKWAARWRAEGRAGMQDRSSRPRHSPTRTARPVVRQIVTLRWRHRLGPLQIGGRLGLPASTVHAVLRRNRLNRLSRIDRVSGEPLRRYEHAYPGSMIHVDVTKFGNIPDGGGHRFVGRQQGEKNQRATPGLARGADYKPRTGIAYLHTVIDDYSRLAYVEICADEKATTAAGVLRRAVAWYDERGVDTERVLSDNGSCYRSNLWRDVCAELGIKHKRTRPYRPQTNGKIERFHRTLADGWAYARHYTSDAETQSSSTGLAPLLQSPPHPLRRQRSPRQQTQQPPWTSQLGQASGSAVTAGGVHAPSMSTRSWKDRFNASCSAAGFGRRRGGCRRGHSRAIERGRRFELSSGFVFHFGPEPSGTALNDHRCCLAHTNLDDHVCQSPGRCARSRLANRLPLPCDPR